MKSRHIDIAIDAGADLAEGPWWDEQRQELLWVDIFAGRIHMLDPASGLDRSIDVGQPVGMVARRQSGDWYAQYATESVSSTPMGTPSSSPSRLSPTLPVIG